MKNFITSLQETILSWGFGFLVLAPIVVFFYSIFSASKILGVVAILLFVVEWYQKYEELSEAKVFVKDQFKI